jgi:thiosulfate dehydrogenase [quinone] large subunit
MTSPKRQAYALLRLTVGVDMLMHGLTRIGSGVEKFVATTVGEFQATILPEPLVHGFALVLPFVEGLLGLVLILGLFTRGALICGSLLMITLVFGTALRSEWNTVGLQLLYAAIYYLLLTHVEHNGYAVDSLRRNDRATTEL